MPTTDGLDNLRAAVDLTARNAQREGPSLRKRSTSNDPEQIRLAWMTPSRGRRITRPRLPLRRPRRRRWCSRGRAAERTSRCRESQDKLIDEIAAVNPDAVVVLNVSQPVATAVAGPCESRSADAGGRATRVGSGDCQRSVGQGEPCGAFALHVGQAAGGLCSDGPGASGAFGRPA